jgi:hypothetical protein
VCTLTFIRTDRGVRLVHSRDEQRDRAEGLLPSEWTAGQFRLLSPRDPDAGGTWIAARDDAVILAVMNRNPEPPPTLDRARLRSRGLIIESLAHLQPDALPDALRAIDGADYAPFRAFAALPGDAASDPVVWAAEWDPTNTATGRPVVTRHDLPACWASSGLGDSVVADRLPLFESSVRPDPSRESQDTYHRHAWPGRGAASVFMSRPDARTVSITTAETFRTDGTDETPGSATPLTARMVYLPLIPGPAIDDPMTDGEPHFATLHPRNLASRG